ncbi:cyclase family protein [Nocardioides sp. NPDC047086]|uniref:cyclase family protein n=1 Tax=Nocardioides sp. NPDC047086 TaxID=3154810 RepID=UPI0033E885E6
MTTHDRPSRAELHDRPGPLRGTSWELFEDPWRGTPSFADEQGVVAAAGLVQLGEAFGLDYPVNAFMPGMSQTRKPSEHVIYGNHPAHRDDYLDRYYLQSSTQVDGLRHRRADDAGFYGGTADELIIPGTEDIGIQVWADRPIVSRGVLVDIAGLLARREETLDHEAGQPIPYDYIDQALTAQAIELRTGDIVMLHTGWCEWFLELTAEQKLAQQALRRATGIAQSEEVLDWAWDTGLALLAADTFAVECLPPVPDSPFLRSAPNDRGMMHQEFLAKLGMPLGELWRLGPLARRMDALQRWEAFLSVKPLNVIGATGSPANAVAIL